MYGEPAALNFAAAHRWLSSVDPDELEDTLTERAAACAEEVVAWGAASGLADLDRGAVEGALMTHDVFAETGWWMLRSLLGLDGVETEMVDEGEPYVISVPSADIPSPRPPRAIALDHSSPGWAHLNAGDLMGRFGEPPCLVEWHRTLYLATDPPVTLFGCDESLLAQVTGATGDWVQVPERHTGSLTAAATWARTHVGTPGAGVPDGRPPLLFEVIDGADRGSVQSGAGSGVDWQLHAIAPPLSASLVVEWSEGADPAAVADALAVVHERVVIAVVGAFLFQGRGVHYGEQAEPGAFELQVGGATRHTSGRFGVTTASPSAWSRLLGRVRSGDLAEVDISATRTNAFGNTWPDHATASLGYHLALTDLEEDPDLAPPTPPSLSVRVDAEFAAIVPVSSLIGLLDRIVDLLPVQRAWLQVSRFKQATTPWLMVLPASRSYDVSAYPDSEVHGELRWLRTSQEAPKFEPRVN